MNCRFCDTKLTNTLVDLHNAPPSNSYLEQQQLSQPETSFPLHVWICDKCFLAQVDEFEKFDMIFNDSYAYFSSFSSSWLAHCESYAEKMIDRFNLHDRSQVIEIASNDGYLLQFFQKKHIPVLGIEPTANTAAVAKEKGIETIVEFFNTSLAQKLVNDGVKADLLAGNNVLAHVPNLLDFVTGLKTILAEDGIITMEFPHLLCLMQENQFDTIYHEHFSYFSLFTVDQIFQSIGLEIFDVDEIPTHGGSLRIYAKHTENQTHKISSSVQSLITKEKEVGLNSLDYFKDFQSKVHRIKLDFINFLIQANNNGKKVVGYGAAAKGNTLLNYCGIKKDMINYIVDRNPNKQNKYMPASHIPIVSEDHLKSDQPDFIIIFPWNIKDEVIKQLDYAKGWGAKFVIPIPELHII